MTFIINEYYHLYNRGAHKAPIFIDNEDYRRFIQLLYVVNDTLKNKRRCDLRRIRPSDMFTYERDTSINIIAYCLMPNHFHIVLKGETENGVHHFVHRLCTAYAMYYNKKYDHSGTIFQGSCKSKYVDTDDYLRYLIQYIHLNPFGIIEPDMNRLAKTEYLDKAIAYSKTYEYSSYKDYLGVIRPQNVIIVSAQVRPAHTNTPYTKPPPLEAGVGLNRNLT